MIRVLLVDDDPLVRGLLSAVLAAARDVDVVAVATDGDEVPDAVAAHRPDVVLMDIQMRRVGGIAATAALRRLADPPSVVALTSFGSDDAVRSALDAGAVGFVHKTADPDDIVKVLRDVAAGHGGLDPAAQRSLIDGRGAERAGTDRRREAQDRLAALTDREREVVAWLPLGLSNPQIAERTYLSASTVKQHLSSAMRTLGVDSREALAVVVDRAGAARED
ncbi:LuxR family two component transcriptional regulator [Isoptericola jiangsuensis]|uniref:LuxR family two component transcriptional regulator n=1 Tax=Isoptericola jiangsuensis TaxID=548579 RepID=A0A2A9ETR1_9MICO|nr:response regulator transcription factor [Isoptericola jiangsuensis]PFG42404.1 LuxR family two component transcriptional regulator [Isoptericola jiangsuensis]